MLHCSLPRSFTLVITHILILIVIPFIRVISISFARLSRIDEASFYPVIFFCILFFFFSRYPLDSDPFRTSFRRFTSRDERIRLIKCVARVTRAPTAGANRRYLIVDYRRRDNHYDNIYDI